MKRELDNDGVMFDVGIADCTSSDSEGEEVEDVPQSSLQIGAFTKLNNLPR